MVRQLLLLFLALGVASAFSLRDFHLRGEGEGEGEGEGKGKEKEGGASESETYHPPMPDRISPEMIKSQLEGAHVELGKSFKYFKGVIADLESGNHDLSEWLSETSEIKGKFREWDLFHGKALGNTAYALYLMFMEHHDFPDEAVCAETVELRKNKPDADDKAVQAAVAMDFICVFEELKQLYGFEQKLDFSHATGSQIVGGIGKYFSTMYQLFVDTDFLYNAVEGFEKSRGGDGSKTKLVEKLLRMLGNTKRLEK